GSRALLSEGLIGALGAYAAASKAAPGAQLTSLSYHDGTTDLTVDAPDVGALDALREAARGRGFNAELQGATHHDTRYQGRSQLRGPGRGAHSTTRGPSSRGGTRGSSRASSRWCAPARWSRPRSCSSA